jgi:hypothetical protein
MNTLAEIHFVRRLRIVNPDPYVRVLTVMRTHGALLTSQRVAQNHTLLTSESLIERSNRSDVQDILYFLFPM